MQLAPSKHVWRAFVDSRDAGLDDSMSTMALPLVLWIQSSRRRLARGLTLAYVPLGNVVFSKHSTT
eukprot:1607251-Rhodomonas_salina.1